MDKIRSNKTHKLRLISTTLPHIPQLALRPIKALSNPRSDMSVATMGSFVPRKIPPDKLEKAIAKYRDILAARAAEALADRAAAPPSGYQSFLTVPPAASVISNSSNRLPQYARSVSEHDGATDISSVVSFQGDDEPSHNNSTSFSGELVKQQKRRPFPPVPRLETALVRFLGSCPDCKARGVRCQLEKHHDVGTLQRIINERDQQQIAGMSHGGSSSGGSHGTARFVSRTPKGIPPPSQHDFLGFGAQLLPSSAYGTPQPEIQSPGGDLLAGIGPGNSFSNIRYQPQVGLDLGTERYAGYGNGAVIIIGLQLESYFLCRHASGCEQLFPDLEALENHFQYQHFSYTRIDPAKQHVCAVCNKTNVAAYLRCQWCFIHGNIQTQIHGHFIRTPEYSYDPETGPAPLQYDPTSDVCYGSAYNSSLGDVEAGPAPYGSFGDEYDPNHYVDSHGSNPYGGPSDQGYGFDGYDGTGMEDVQFQGNIYRSARQLALKHSILRVLYTNVRRHSQRLKHVLFVLLSLIAVIIFLTHDELISQAQQAFPQAGPEIREHLPTIGFIVIVVSFGASFIMKHRTQQPSTVTVHSGHCSLRAIAPYAKRYGESAASKYVGCGAPS